MKQNTNTFSNIFKLFFVAFSLYLLGDVFKRWDGIKFYASFYEFLPSIALVFILWTFLALVTSFFIWLIFKFFSNIFNNINLVDILVFFLFLTLTAFLLYSGKILLKNIELTRKIKIILLSISIILPILPTWLLRNKSEKLFSAVNQRIIPLVWLFSLLLIISFPLVAYKTLQTIDHQPSVSPLNTQYNETSSRTNIILVTFDSMTARNMSAYGYKRQTTPFISKWAKSASLFSRVKSESTYTTPTTSSLMTGKRVWSHQTYFVEVASKYVGENDENLPFILKKYGYTNIALQQIHQASVNKLGLTKNFDMIFSPDSFMFSTSFYKHIDSFLYSLFGEKIIVYDWIIKSDFILFKFINKLSSDSSVTAQRPESAFNKFLEILDNDLHKPYFAWIHLFAPHDPYLPPKPYKGMFNPSNELRTWKSQVSGNPLKKINVYRDRYDEFIRYADKQFEDFITQLEKRSEFKNTVIILSADHGESFDHDYKGHGGIHLFEDLTHIPLIIKEPNQTKGQVIDYLAEQIDITPMILDFANIPVPTWMEGYSLLPLIRGESLSPKPAFSMGLGNNPGRDHEIKKGTIAIWEGDYKLIYYLDNESALLFNIKEDPYEKTNLIAIETTRGNKLLSTIKENLQAANDKILALQ